MRGRKALTTAARHLRDAALALAVACSGTVACVNPIAALLPLFQTPRTVPNKVSRVLRPDARLAVLWVGHATVLVQIDDKLILTDPVFTSSVGQVAQRIVEPGVEAEVLPMLDLVLVSHLHFDHLSLGSLELLEDKIGAMTMPGGGLVYLTDFAFPVKELKPWESHEVAGMRVTATPVVHSGWRYGIDSAWMHSSTSYVVEYHGISLYFGGDTAYSQALFREVGARFPGIDLAILPIGPIAPEGRKRKEHIDPAEALSAFSDLRARTMLPIHYDTFVLGNDEVGDAPRALRNQMARRNIDPGRVPILAIGEQRTIVPR